MVLLDKHLKKETFLKDKMKMINLVEELTTPEDIVHTEKNENFRKKEGRFCK